MGMDGIKGYKIMLVTGGSEQEMGSVAANKLDFVVTGLTQGVASTFVVRTEDTLGRVSDASNQATVTPVVQPPVITSPTNGAMVSTYSMAVSGKAEAGSTILVLKTISGQMEEIGNTDSLGFFNGTISLPAEDTYNLKFYARINGITSSPATERSIVVDAKPAVPTNLGLVSGAALDTRAKLTWTRNSEADVVKYNVYRDGNLVPLIEVTQPPSGIDPTLEDLALTNGNEYRYQVEAVDARGNKSGLSAPFSVIPVAGQEWGE